MTFSGEASWRWKMLLPSSDRSYEFFWRQAARWVAGPAADPVDITLPDNASPGDVPVAVDVRDAQFAVSGMPSLRARSPRRAGERRASGCGDRIANGRYTATVRAAGTRRSTESAPRRGEAARVLGAAERWMDIGGVDREFVDPRLNEAWLRRVARASGGRYVRPSDASRIVGWLQETTPQQGAPERRDLWHEPLAFAVIVALLSAEWILRRRWGLR